MEEKIYNSFYDAIMPIVNKLNELYWRPMHQYLIQNPELVKTVPGFLILPEKVIFYFGKTHLGIEYTGAERIEKLPDEGKFEVQVFDYTQLDENFLEKIIGFKYDDSSSDVQLPLGSFLEELIMPTNKGADKLEELNWHFGAQESITIFNAGSPYLMENHFTRIVNGLFFDANESGLNTRHIKWIDFVPVYYDDADGEKDQYNFDLSPFLKMVPDDCNYVYPLPDTYDYQHSKLQRVNRLIELVGNEATTETEITRFLSMPENHFILSMRFGAVAIHSEVECHWQSEGRSPIRPDFFIVQPNGFADIVEFKLPTAKLGLVGKENRESLSSQINTYVSQTRTYRNYFDDPNNRKWFEETHEYKVYRPRRILVIGRRWQFESDIWREIISDYTDFDILTYDDLVDGVVAQLYM